MSIKLIAKVWDSGKYTQGTLLVLLALADWADDEGGRVYPSLAKVGAKSRLTIRQVRRIMRKLEADGVITKVHDGGPEHKPSQYEINPDILSPAQWKADMDVLHRRTSETQKADTDVRPSVSDPLKEPPIPDGVGGTQFTKEIIMRTQQAVHGMGGGLPGGTQMDLALLDVQEYGIAAFEVACVIAAGANVPTLRYVNGILRRGGGEPPKSTTPEKKYEYVVVGGDM